LADRQFRKSWRRIQKSWKDKEDAQAEDYQNQDSKGSTPVSKEERNVDKAFESSSI